MLWRCGGAGVRCPFLSPNNTVLLRVEQFSSWSFRLHRLMQRWRRIAIAHALVCNSEFLQTQGTVGMDPS